MENTVLIAMPLTEYKVMVKELLREVVREELSPIRKQFEEKLITKDEVAKRLGVTPMTLYNLEKRGDLIPDRIGSKVMYRESIVTQYINRKQS